GRWRAGAARRPLARPQWGGPRRDFTWNETGIIEKFPASGPKVLWRTKVETGYTGPAVAGGRVYLMDYTISEGDPKPDPSKRNQLKGTERVICLDAVSGKQLWEHQYDSPYAISYPEGPRCTPAIDGDRVYTLGAEGQLFCFQAADGKILWEKQLKTAYGMKESPLWGFSAHPLVHGDMLYCVVGGEGSVAVAFDKLTGEERWRSLSAREPGYCPPTILTIGGREQLVIWHAEAINGLDPKTGSVLWSQKLEPNYGMAIAAPVTDGMRLYASGLAVSSAFQFTTAASGPAPLWADGKGFTTSHSPVLAHQGFIYGVDRLGWLRCIDFQTGERKWQTTEPVVGPRPVNPGTAFIVRNGDRYFIAAETGELTIARLSPDRYEKISSVKLLEPTHESFGHLALWSAPAYANGCIFWRNDKEIICVSLKEE
ncbi:MAG: PQQ-binding-like beta-propeller repeat protein, partial [Planctomycetota bacterium]